MAQNWTVSPWQDAVESDMPSRLQQAFQQAAYTSQANRELQMRYLQMQQNWALAQQERQAQQQYRQQQTGMAEQRLGLEREQFGLDKTYRQAQIKDIESQSKQRSTAALADRVGMAQKQRIQNLGMTAARSRAGGNDKAADMYEEQIIASNPAALASRLDTKLRTDAMLKMQGMRGETSTDIATMQAKSRLMSALSTSLGLDPMEANQIADAVFAAPATGAPAPTTASEFPDEASARAAGHESGAVVTIKGVGKVRLH
jgi:hypothetical protein